MMGAWLDEFGHVVCRCGRRLNGPVTRDLRPWGTRQPLLSTPGRCRGCGA